MYDKEAQLFVVILCFIGIIFAVAETVIGCIFISWIYGAIGFPLLTLGGFAFHKVGVFKYIKENFL